MIIKIKNRPKTSNTKKAIAKRTIPQKYSLTILREYIPDVSERNEQQQSVP